MISIAGFIIVALILGLFVLILLIVIHLLLSKTISPITKTVVGLFLIIAVLLSGYLFVLLRSTPPAQAISDVLDITDASGELSIRSIRMPEPAYVDGKGTIEKFYMSNVKVDVANNSGQEVCLGLEYYADSGSIGPYSPGVSMGAKIVAVHPNWAGVLRFPLRHPRFIAGSYVRLTLAICQRPESKVSSLPPGSEILFKKKYNMVSEQQPPNKRIERTR